MCDYTQVEYACGHLRYIVKAWCTTYPETQKRCPLNVVAMFVLLLSGYRRLTHPIPREYRLDEICGDCKSARPPSTDIRFASR